MCCEVRSINIFKFRWLYFSILKLLFDPSDVVSLCWDTYVSIFFESVCSCLLQYLCSRATLKAQIISALVSLWCQPLSICPFSCNLKCSWFFACPVRLDCILGVCNIVTHLLLLKPCWEGWRFGVSRQTALSGSCCSFDLPSARCSARAALLSPSWRCYSDVSHVCAP